MGLNITDYDKVEAWVSIGEKFQEENFLKRYNDNTALYHGPQHCDEVDDDGLTVNTVGPTVDSLVSSYYARNPRAVVTANRDFTVGGKPLSGSDTASLIEELVWHTVKGTNFKKQVRQVCVDGEVAGYGGVDIGWIAEVAKIPLPANLSPSGKKTDVSIDYLAHVRKQEPYIKRGNPKQWLLPPFACDFDSMPHLIYWEDVPVDVVVSEPSFATKAKSELKDMISRGSGSFLSGFNSEDGKHQPFWGAKLQFENIKDVPDFGMIRLFHFYSLKNNQYFVFAKELRQFLREGPMPFTKMDGYPAEFLSFLPAFDGIYPLANVDWYRDQAIQKNTLRRRYIDAVQKQVSKILTRVTDEEELSRVSKAGQGEVVKVKNPDAYREIILSGLPADWLRLEQIINGDIVSASGVPEQRQGLSSGSDLATDLVQRERAFQTRVTAKQDALKDFLQSVYKKVWQLYAEKTTGKQTLRISDDKGGIDFRQWTKNDIQGDYDFEINIESAALDSPQREIAETSQLLILSNQFPDVIGTDGRRELFKRLAQASKIDNPESIANPPQDPDAMKLAEFEFVFMQQGQQVDPAPGENHEQHAKVHQFQLETLAQKQQLRGNVSEEEVRAAALLQDHIAKTIELMQPQGGVESPQRVRPSRQNTGSVDSPDNSESAGRSQGQAEVAGQLRGQRG